MVWGGITATGRTDLVIINGNLNAVGYRDNIVRQHVLPFLQQHRGVTFQQDNARPHVARVVTAFFNQHNVPVLPWPSCSPDLNPIEHLWDEMKRRLGAMPNPPRNRNQLQQALTNIWNAIPQAFIATLVRSMRRRLTACVAAQGGHTRY